MMSDCAEQLAFALLGLLLWQRIISVAPAHKHKTLVDHMGLAAFLLLVLPSGFIGLGAVSAATFWVTIETIFQPFLA